VDTGFVVFNRRNYPLFVRLLEKLGVGSQPTTMSFSVKCERTGLEYCGTSLSTVFAQPSNLWRPAFLRMLWDILRFNRHSVRLLEQGVGTLTLGDLVRQGGYSRFFRDYYLGPMGAAIWSCAPEDLFRFPAFFFLRFFHNHGLLTVGDQPQWRVIRGGSRRYVEALIAPFRARIRLETPVEKVRRGPDRVQVKPRGDDWQPYDQVILATHSDQALHLLEDPSAEEEEILGSFPYQENEAILHTDSTLLPSRRRARASWNYHIPRQEAGAVVVTYDMSRLQGLASPSPFCLSLNPAGGVRPEQILRRLHFTHPRYTLRSPAAQRRHGEISGVRRTHYCGAYWGNGFHEDGVRSAVAVGRHFGAEL
jgi:predicted NAD/FAD-binding protein